METASKDCLCNESRELGIIRTKRHLPPQHYSIRIKQFSLLAEKQEKYESFTFEAEGYKWKLWLYPKGNTNSPANGKDHISLYLAIQDTNSLPQRWEAKVELKLFVYNQIEDKYLAVHDGTIKQFHEMKTVWGIDQFLSLKTFNDASNGYFVDDTCVFGAEVFVIQPSGIYESVYTVKNPGNGSFTWKIPNFSKLDGKTLFSEQFVSENRKWRLRVDPKGNKAGKDNSLSVYLHLIEAEKLGDEEKVFADYELRVLNKDKSKHVKGTFSHWHTNTTTEESHMFGRHKFMALEDVHDVSKGFLVNDTLTVEVEIIFVSVAKVVP